MGMRKKSTTKRSKKGKVTLKKLAKKVNRLTAGIETKHFRTTGLGALPTNNPTLAILPYENISQGDDDYGTRIGDKMTSSFIKFKSTWTLGAGFVGTTARIVAFIYKDTPDGLASPSAITVWNLYAESAYANGVNIVNGNKDYDNRKAFVTLYDKKVDFNPSESTLSYRKSWDFNLVIPKRYQQVQYSAASLVRTRNDLYIFLIAENDTGFSVNYVCENYYSDI